MLDQLEIACPGPTKPTKRKDSRLSSLEESEAVKRSRFSSSPAAKIFNWLTAVPSSPETSDSRSHSRQCFRAGLSTNGRTRSDPGLCISHISASPSSAIIDRSITSHGPPSKTSPVLTRPKAIITYAESATSSSKSETGNVLYREYLANHNLYVDPMGEAIPTPVAAFVQDVVRKPRTSPPLSDQQVQFIRTRASKFACGDELTVQRHLLSTSMFPQIEDYPESIQYGGNTPFTTTPLPHTPSHNFPPISTPKPDQHSGYEASVFTPAQRSVLNHPRLSPYARPTASNVLPNLVFELKSQSRGGTHWVAQNQAAGAGAHCVNSMETLLAYAREKTGKSRDICESLAFSCVIDAESVTLWVHFLDNSNFTSSRIGGYWIAEPEDVRRFRQHARNIVDHTLSDRLDSVKQALDVLLPRLPQWDAESKYSKPTRRGRNGQSTSSAGPFLSPGDRFAETARPASSSTSYSASVGPNVDVSSPSRHRPASNLQRDGTH